MKSKDFIAIVLVRFSMKEHPQIQALMAMKDFVKRMMKNPAKFVQSIMVSHPLGFLMSESEFEKSLNNIKYEFRKNVAALMIRCFKPELSLSERSFRDTISQINQVFSREYWQEAHRFNKLMSHAETLCQALSYGECLDVLARQAMRDFETGRALLPLSSSHYAADGRYLFGLESIVGRHGF